MVLHCCAYFWKHLLIVKTLSKKRSGQTVSVLDKSWKPISKTILTHQILSKHFPYGSPFPNWMPENANAYGIDSKHSDRIWADSYRLFSWPQHPLFIKVFSRKSMKTVFIDRNYPVKRYATVKFIYFLRISLTHWYSIRLFVGASKMMMIWIYWIRWKRLSEISRAFDSPTFYYQRYQLAFRIISNRKVITFQIQWPLLYPPVLKPKVLNKKHFKFKFSFNYLLLSFILQLGAQLKLQNKFSVGLQTLPIRTKKIGNRASHFHSKMMEVKKYSDFLRGSPDYFVSWFHFWFLFHSMILLLFLIVCAR